MSETSEHKIERLEDVIWKLEKLMAEIGEVADRQAKAIRDAITKLDGPGMPDRAREAIHILMEAQDDSSNN